MELLPQEYDFANSLIDEFYDEDWEGGEEGGFGGGGFGGGEKEEVVYPSWRVGAQG